MDPTGPHAVVVFNLGMDQHQQPQLRVVLGQPGKHIKATTTTSMGKSSSPAGQAKKRQSWVGLLATKVLWRKRRDQAVKKWRTSSSNATQRRQLGGGGEDRRPGAGGCCRGGHDIGSQTREGGVSMVHPSNLPGEVRRQSLALIGEGRGEICI
jgi:hypothetical protein